MPAAIRDRHRNGVPAVDGQAEEIDANDRQGDQGLRRGERRRGRLLHAGVLLTARLSCNRSTRQSRKVNAADVVHLALDHARTVGSDDVAQLGDREGPGHARRSAGGH